MGKNILLIVSLLLFGVLLFGCAAPDVGGGAGGAGERGGAGGAGEVGGGAGAEGAGGAEVEAIDVSGRLGEKLNSGAAELTVHSYTFGANVGYGATAMDWSSGNKFLVLNVTINNLRNSQIDPFRRFEVFDSLSGGSFGSRCLTQAAEVIPRGAFSSARLSAGEERSGLVVCTVKRDARNIRFKFDTITAQVYNYNDHLDEFVVTGKVGQFVGNEHSSIQIKVNSVQFIRDASDDAGQVTYRGVSSDRPSTCYWDNLLFGGSRNNYPCSIVVLSLTVKNTDPNPWNGDLTVARFKLEVGSEQRISSEPSYATRSRLEKFYEVLESPLQLQNLAPGEERTGDLIYLAGVDVPDRTDIPLWLTREDIVSFGKTRINLRETAAGGAGVVADQPPVQQAEQESPVQEAAVQDRYG